MKRIILLLGILVAAVGAKAHTAAQDTVFVERGTIVIFTDTVAENAAAGSMTTTTVTSTNTSVIPAPLTAEQQRAQKFRNSTAKARTKNIEEEIKVRFAWGADLGSSIDMSANDMSSIDLSLAFGMRRGWINFLGVGAQGNIMISNSYRSFPFFLLFRTNFTDRPTRVFWELKGGLSLNYLEHKHRQERVYGSTGIGIRLASSAKFSSHMVLAYTYMQRKQVVGPEMTHDFTDLHYATVKLGVTF